ncbi:hypothetical protein IPA_07315 [Ignicoccus pacificus DSM 13166]|uniref:Uncharacterized protein n=1 Tax=Ignicoccus pacificus DSM 13166 TaxID=940294 RepID=A0A977PKB0_9CREN|nr:hypothetical protein IPA_07315 [Ignicoccus pacificus DSM 13166]
MLKWMIGLVASMWISIVIGIIVALMKMGDLMTFRDSAVSLSLINNERCMR